ncbi:hypothetical protein JAAARDRAFT_613253 [Jaapia argillacea MUCL 33604]|uniref:Protein kinase domain-containing protein n=1 Tax=Jaapia argillacea MUCL 33604 TaxID=933084 RepID=A0A067P7Z8_9AGAM|nr:hypothetical protein JAAARDRAFT_613253 [Jaapia argillacea MUCL 33604]
MRSLTIRSADTFKRSALLQKSTMSSTIFCVTTNGVKARTSHAIALLLTTPTTHWYTLAPSFVDHLMVLEDSARDSVRDWQKRSRLLYDDDAEQSDSIEDQEMSRNSSFVAGATLSKLSLGGNSPLSTGEVSQDTLGDTLKRVRVAILVWLQGLVETEVTRNQILELRGKEAEDFAEALQKVLDWTRDDRKIRTLFPKSPTNEIQTLRRRCRRLLTNLAKQSGELPPSLFLCEGVDRPGKDPVHGGGFADIYKGTYGDQCIALKRIRMFIGERRDAKKLRKMFFNETLVWRQLDHSSIVPFIGIWREEPDSVPYMILPWMANGNAQHFVQDKAITAEVVLQLLVDVIDGLVYLHAESIFHGDLCGKNILIDKDHHARLCDFGLASLFSDPASALYNPTSTQSGGTTRWMAPEILAPGPGANVRPTKHTDIYAFGCVGVELYSGQDPFTGISDRDIILGVPRGLRPSNPGEGAFGRPPPPEVWQMFEKCWEGTAKERPEAAVVLKCLRDIQVANR